MNLYEVDKIPVLHFIVLALMVYRLTRFFIADALFEPVRDWIFKKKPPHSSTFGYLFTCEWCISLWIALPTMVFYAFYPSATFLVGCIFALSALAGLITARLDK